MNKIAIVLVVYGVFFLIGLFFLIKNNNTFNQHIKISHAIYEYHIYCIYNKPRDYNSSLDVDYCDEEGYGKTLFRIFDWGCENILPKEKYELVKKYIK
jgi:hypothetical protein